MAMESEDQKTFEITEDITEDSSLDEWLLEKQLSLLQDEVETNNVAETTLPKEELDLKNFTPKDEVPKADLFVCKLCNRAFIDDCRLRSHMYKVHRIYKQAMPVKGGGPGSRQRESWLPDVQRLAVRGPDGKVFVCDQCPYRVSRCDSMTKHVLRVHNKGLLKPQYMCEVCGKTFVDRAYLRNHSLSHVQEPQYFCEICGRRFHRQPSLKRHIEGHSNEKQFICGLCDYQTNRKHLMFKHSENHRTGKAYSCKQCMDKFFTQMALRKHCYVQHPSRYSCSFCKIGFSSRERMWSHMQKSHFACEVTDLKTEEPTFQEVKVEYIEVQMEPKYV